MFKDPLSTIAPRPLTGKLDLDTQVRCPDRLNSDPQIYRNSLHESISSIHSENEATSRYLPFDSFMVLEDHGQYKKQDKSLNYDIHNQEFSQHRSRDVYDRSQNADTPIEETTLTRRNRPSFKGEAPSDPWSSESIYGDPVIGKSTSSQVRSISVRSSSGDSLNTLSSETGATSISVDTYDAYESESDEKAVAGLPLNSDYQVPLPYQNSIGGHPRVGDHIPSILLEQENKVYQTSTNQGRSFLNTFQKLHDNVLLMERKAFSMWKQLVRPRLKAGWRRLEWTCVSNLTVIYLVG